MEHRLNAGFLGFGGPWGMAAKEALACLGMSVKTIRHDGIWWRSALLSLATTLLWLVLYYYFWDEFMRFSGQAARISLLGLLSASELFSDSSGDGGNFLGWLWGNTQALFHFVQLTLIALAMAGAFYMLLFIFAVQTTMSLCSRWLLLERIHGVASKPYAPTPRGSLTNRQPTGLEALKEGVKLLLLCIPILSLLVVVRYLLIWNLRWFAYKLVGTFHIPGVQKRAMLLLGVVFSLIMLVPILNLMLPALLCASVCHLHFRSAQREPGDLVLETSGAGVST